MSCICHVYVMYMSCMCHVDCMLNNSQETAQLASPPPDRCSLHTAWACKARATFFGRKSCIGFETANALEHASNV